MKVFHPFCLDTVNQCIWRLGDTGLQERILLSPKAFALLAYLVDHAGRLVTHDELLEAVWPGSVVEPQAVKKHVLAVRSALGDRPKNSFFIETVIKRGYRFIAAITEFATSRAVVSGEAAQGTLVGRRGSLEELHEAWERVLGGERQIVFITGEPGIGKTALAQTFRDQVAAGERSGRIAQGQCIEGVWNQGTLRSDARGAGSVVSRRAGRAYRSRSLDRSPDMAGAISSAAYARASRDAATGNSRRHP
jgi:DNA-binding winged helix-turn-helix (wHTH) protein